MATRQHTTYILALVVWALAHPPGGCWGQELTLPAEVKGVKGKFVTVIAETKATEVTWIVEDFYGSIDLFPSELLANKKATVLIASADGRYRLWAVACVDKKLVKTHTFIVIGDPGPTPPGPKPPTPPDPPKPEPSPIAADGLHVMVLFETADKSKMSKGHFDIVYGMEMRQWLKANCTADTGAGDGKAYWIVDKDADLSQLAKKWQDAVQRPRTSVPWLIISNRPKGGYEGPLPVDTEATIKLLERFK